MMSCCWPRSFSCTQKYWWPSPAPHAWGSRLSELLHTRRDAGSLQLGVWFLDGQQCVRCAWDTAAKQAKTKSYSRLFVELAHNDEFLKLINSAFSHDYAFGWRNHFRVVDNAMKGPVMGGFMGGQLQGPRLYNGNPLDMPSSGIFREPTKISTEIYSILDWMSPVCRSSLHCWKVSENPRMEHRTCRVFPESAVCQVISWPDPSQVLWCGFWIFFRFSYIRRVFRAAYSFEQVSYWHETLV
jgi:hypothetical protein